jgi:hypothetical protein
LQLEPEGTLAIVHAHDPVLELGSEQSRDLRRGGGGSIRNAGVGASRRKNNQDSTRHYA